MKRAGPLLFGALIACSTAVFAAGVYKSVDENGNVVYSDEPRGNAKKVDLPPLTTYPAPRLPPPQSRPAQQDAEQAAVYSSLEIAQPRPEATVWDNTGTVTVQASSEPALFDKAGHRFQFYLNGEPVGAQTRDAAVTLSDVVRGAHEVSVAIVDTRGQPLKKSDSVRFYLHQQSQNYPFGPKPTQPAPAPAP